MYTDSLAAKHESYAIELYKPYAADSDPNKWTLHINAASYDVNWSSGEQYHIIAWQDASYPLPITGGSGVFVQSKSPSGFPIFGAGSTISLVRKAKNDDIVVDFKIVPTNWPLPATASDGNYCDQRDITTDKCTRRLWEDPCDYNLAVNLPRLGQINTYISSDANLIFAHPANIDFNSIGQIGMVFSKAAYYNITSLGDRTNTIGYTANLNKEGAGTSESRQHRLSVSFQLPDDLASLLRIRPQCSNQRQNKYQHRAASVLAQLPWVSHRKGGYTTLILPKR